MGKQWQFASVHAGTPNLANQFLFGLTRRIRSSASQVRLRPYRPTEEVVLTLKADPATWEDSEVASWLGWKSVYLGAQYERQFKENSHRRSPAPAAAHIFSARNCPPWTFSLCLRG